MKLSCLLLAVGLVLIGMNVADAYCCGGYGAYWPSYSYSYYPYYSSYYYPGYYGYGGYGGYGGCGGYGGLGFWKR